MRDCVDLMLLGSRRLHVNPMRACSMIDGLRKSHFCNLRERRFWTPSRPCLFRDVVLWSLFGVFVPELRLRLSFLPPQNFQGFLNPVLLYSLSLRPMMVRSGLGCPQISQPRRGGLCTSGDTSFASSWPSTSGILVLP